MAYQELKQHLGRQKDTLVCDLLPMNTPETKIGLRYDENATWDRCGQFGAFDLGGRFLCSVCYEEADLQGAGIYSDRIRYPLPSLLITDLKMPSRTGSDLLAWIKTQAQFSQLPTIVLTSSAVESDKQGALELGASSYLVKPSHLEDLVVLARGRLEKHWVSAASLPRTIGKSAGTLITKPTGCDERQRQRDQNGEKMSPNSCR